MTASSEPVPAGAPAASPKPKTHPCVRCGAPVPLDVGLCERCNPLGLKDAAASQVHGTVVIAIILAIIGLAFLGHLALAGVGPFPASIVATVPNATGLDITLTVTNKGSAAGQTTCRLTDPADRNGKQGAFVLSPQIDPGQTVTFTKPVTDFGTVVRPLDIACNAP